jgi:hypothetical protein
MTGWERKGLLFEAAGRRPWMASHAALPVVEALGDRLRVYFGSRDPDGRSRIGSFDARLGEPPEVLAVAEEPVLSLGALGTFDDSGVTPSCLVERAGTRYLYYTGWSRGVTVPFYLHAGVAVQAPGEGAFRRLSAAPLLDRSPVDPYLTASPWVLAEEDRWRMWYVSGTEWSLHEGSPRHRYHIRYAESEDGLRWERRGIVCLDYRTPEEHAFGRPCVVRDGPLYRMWYCHRGARYRLGYAESTDGLAWTRRDHEAGLDPSPEGWDSEMLAYPLVFDHRDRRYLLYNGNGYGRTGIGLAVAERALLRPGERGVVP